MRAITVFSAAYVVVSAATLSAIGSVTSISAVIGSFLFSLAFSYPLITCYLLARWVPASRTALLSLEVVFSGFSVIVFCAIFAGEHDAQYQLGLLVIPVVGLLVVVTACIIAAAIHVGMKSAKGTG